MRRLHVSGGKFVFVGVVVSVVLLLGAPQLATFPTPQAHGSPGAMLWQNPNAVQPCNATYTAQALRYLGDETFQHAGAGCTQNWLIVVGQSERGNITEEAAWFNARNSSFEGVVLDDAGSTGLSEVPLFNSRWVCPILYTPVSSFTANCVVMVISLRFQAGNVTAMAQVASQTKAQWETSIRQSLANVHANRTMILEYAEAPSSWHHPRLGTPLSIPPAYLEACASVAKSLNDTLVVWY